jgi:chloramphenicol O-acetyltransferase type A
MRYIDIESWPRRKHFEAFNTFDYPHFNLCANVKVSALHSLVKRRGLSFTVSIAYFLARVANAISEFRYRIREGCIVEHEVVHPSITILTESDLFSFCTIPYTEDFKTYATRAMEQIDYVKDHPTLEDEPGQDDLLFMTSIPWVSFTGLMHPIHMHPVDSVPRIAWGKFFQEADQIKMPLSVQVHHALMDGLHVGQYFLQLQELLDRAERVLNGG